MFEKVENRALNRRESEFLERRYNDFLSRSIKFEYKFYNGMFDRFDFAHIGILKGILRSKRGIVSNSKKERDKKADEYFYRAINKFLFKWWEEKRVTDYISDIEGTLDGWKDCDGLTFGDCYLDPKEVYRYSIERSTPFLNLLFGIRRAKQIISGENFNPEEQKFIRTFKNALIDVDKKLPGICDVFAQMCVQKDEVENELAA